MKSIGRTGWVWALFLVPVGLVAQFSVELRGRLPGEVSESSGLLLRGGVLITHNDSGNQPVLYELDTVSLEVLRQVRIAGVENTDWEDLAEDDGYMYIGDIGNNRGIRTDLRILRVSKTEYDRSDEVEAEVIAYRYEDQTAFADNGNSDWDAEALVSWGDSLLIFTKQWQSGGTVVYSLPKAPGDYQARRLAEIPTTGMITSAAPLAGKGGLVLLGYSATLQPFSVLVPSVGTSLAFHLATEKEALDIGFGQTEGICPDNGNRYYVSSEAYANGLFTLPASVFVLSPVVSANEEDVPEPDPVPAPSGPGEAPEGFGLRVYRAPGSPVLEYQLEEPQTILARAVYDSAGKRVYFGNGPGDRPGQVDISTLETSIYYLALYVGNRVLSRPFLSN